MGTNFKAYTNIKDIGYVRFLFFLKMFTQWINPQMDVNLKDLEREKTQSNFTYIYEDTKLNQTYYFLHMLKFWITIHFCYVCKMFVIGEANKKDKNKKNKIIICHLLRKDQHSKTLPKE